MSSALPGSSVDGQAQPQPDIGPPLEAFIRSMLISGHRLAVDLRSYESMVARLDTELAHAPGNPSFQDELRRKTENRDRARSEIESLSRELAESLRLALKPIVNRSDSHAPEIHHLESQTQHIQRTTDEARREMVNVINKLTNNYKNLVGEIADLRHQVEEVKPLVTTHAPGAGVSAASIAHTEELQALKSSLASLADRVTDLHRDFIITLSVDMPANLKEAVRLIQNAANTSAQSIIESNHRQHGVLLKEFCDEYGSRIEAIERNMNRNTLIPPSEYSRAHHQNDAHAEDQTQFCLEDQSQSQDQNQTRLSKDPRRRHTPALMEIDRPPGSNISLLPSAPPDSDSECKQQ